MSVLSTTDSHKSSVSISYVFISAALSNKPVGWTAGWRASHVAFASRVMWHSSAAAHYSVHPLLNGVLNFSVAPGESGDGFDKLKRFDGLGDVHLKARSVDARSVFETRVGRERKGCNIALCCVERANFFD